MTKLSRSIWLGVIGIIGTLLAWGAWRQSPGQDPDNQGGYVIVLLFVLILLFIYVPLGVRSLVKYFCRSKPLESRPPTRQPGDHWIG